MGLPRLGRYTLLHPLGAGGMAEVHVARRDGSPEICALKRLLPEIVAHPTAGPRFLREAHLVSFLHHPGIARVQGAGAEGDSFCIEMEFIAGATLAELGARLERSGGRLPPDLVLTVGIAALDALAHAHAARGPDGAPLHVVHRDLTPRNVMVDATGRTKIIDFGVARAALDEFKTQPGVIIGSLRYFSPEQARADPVDARSDLYSLAVTLHEALTGRALVPAGGSAFDILRAVLEVPAPLASDVAPVPRRLAEVLARGLAKDPSERWPTAAAFRDALIASGLPRASERSIGELVRGELADRLAQVEGWRATARALHAAAEEAPPEAALETRGAGPATLSDDTEPHTQPDSAPTQLTHGGELVPTHLARSRPPAPLAELAAQRPPRPDASARRSFVLGALGGGGLVAVALAIAFGLARSSATAPVAPTVVPTPTVSPPTVTPPTVTPTPVEPPRPVTPEVSAPTPPPPSTRAVTKPKSSPPRPKVATPAPPARQAPSPVPPVGSAGGDTGAISELERGLRRLAQDDLNQLDIELSRAARGLPAPHRDAVMKELARLRAGGGRTAADAAIDKFLALKSGSR